MLLLAVCQIFSAGNLYTYACFSTQEGLLRVNLQSTKINKIKFCLVTVTNQGQIWLDIF